MLMFEGSLDPRVLQYTYVRDVTRCLMNVFKQHIIMPTEAGSLEIEELWF